MEKVRKELIQLQKELSDFRTIYGNQWDDFMIEDFIKIQYRIALMKDNSGLYIMDENYLNFSDEN